MLWYICLIISALIIAVTVPLFVRMRVFKRKKAVVSYQDFSDGVHFTTVYYNEYGDSSNSWNICLDIENHTFTKVYNNRGSSILATRYVDNRTIASVENNNYLNPNDPEYRKTFINFIGLGGDVVRKVALLSLLHQRTACGKIGKRRAIINSFQRRIYYAEKNTVRHHRARIAIHAFAHACLCRR